MSKGVEKGWEISEPLPFEEIFEPNLPCVPYDFEFDINRPEVGPSSFLLRNRELF